MTQNGQLQIEKFCPACDRRFEADEHLFDCPEDGVSLMPVTQDTVVNSVVADKYLIGELIGTGGWSKVYRAVQIQLERIVAFKLLRADLVASAERIKRFDEEARLASGLSHPNICAVYDCGILESGQPYLILEHIQGKSLARVLQDDGALEAKRATRLLKQIANALFDAHQRGIVHRDLKPGNIMVVGTGEAEEIKIIDFGLAKAFAAEDREQLTHTGMTIGTPCYMSPEQVLGEQLDCRSDIYSYGCLAYEMLTGRKPVHGSSVFETMNSHLVADPPPMSSEELTVAQPLEELTLTCLRKDAGDRYQTMADVEQALDSFEKFGKVERYKPRRWSRKARKSLKIATLVAALLVPLGVIAYSFGGFSTYEAEQKATTKKSVAMQEFERLRRADDYAAAEKAGAKLFEQMKVKNQQLAPEFSDLAGQMHRLYVEHDQQHKAPPYIKAAFDARKRIVAPGSEAELQAYSDAANALVPISDKESLPYLLKLTDLIAKRDGANRKRFCEALYHRAWCKFRTGDGDGAEKDYTQLLSIVPKFYPEKDLFKIRSLHRLALVQLDKRKYREALATCELALPMISDDTPTNLSCDLLQKAARAARDSGDFAKAVSLYKRAYPISLQINPSESEVILGDMGVCMVSARQYKEAEPALKEAMQKLAARWGPDCDAYQICLGKYVEMLRSTGKSKQADAVQAAGKV
jgi:serine/threonine protein kinase